MKKLYFSALSIIFGLSLNAQTLTQANHAPSNGDKYSTYQCDSSFLPGAGTASSNWTYALITHSSIVNNFTTQTTANPGYPGADISVSSNTANILYYKSSPTDLKHFGGYLNLNGIAAQVTYTAPAIYASYPMSFGTTTLSNTSGSLSVLGQNGTFTGSCNANADGTGTLSLPSRTFTSVIRIVTSQTINFTTGFGPGTVTQKTYDYYSISDSKYPILSHSSSSVNAPPAAPSTRTFVNVQKNYQVVGLKENVKEEVSLNVYPNPSNSVVNFMTENVNAKTVLMYDITGKFIESQNLTNGKLILNVADYNAGLYIYKLNDGTNKTVKTGKLTVIH